MLEQAGIHANAHSTRSAATSAAFAAGMSIKNIIDTANWAKESTFKRFYCRPVVLQQHSAARYVRYTSGQLTIYYALNTVPPRHRIVNSAKVFRPDVEL